MTRRRVLIYLLVLWGLLPLVACEEGERPREWATTGAYQLTETTETVSKNRSLATPMADTPMPVETTLVPSFTPTPQPCGLTFPLVSARPVAGIQVFAGPHPASPGSSLFYCVTFEASRYEIPVPLRIHLPEGSRLDRVAGAGWMCTSETDVPHELTCTNTRAGRGVSPLLLEVILPETAGPWQACVELTKPPSPRVCVTIPEE